MAKVKLLGVWLGNPPEWFDKFADRMRGEFAISWEWLPFTWGEFSERVQATTGIVTAEDVKPIKLCDFRPLYGQIFKDKLEGYDFWGWHDMDCVFGYLSYHLNQGVLKKSDVITDHCQITNGPLTVVRNTKEMNNLWKDIPDVLMKLEDDAYYNIDEDEFATRQGFTKAVKDNPDIRFTCLNSHEHDGKDPTPVVKGQKLFSGWGGKSREIVTYHFSKSKRWPL